MLKVKKRNINIIFRTSTHGECVNMYIMPADAFANIETPQLRIFMLK